MRRSGIPSQSVISRFAALDGRMMCGGRYWDRTSDLFRVKEARYRCANRPLAGRGSEVATGLDSV